MAIRKRGLSSQNTAELANLNIGYPPEIFSLDIYLTFQIFGTPQNAKSGEKSAHHVITTEAKPRFPYPQTMAKNLLPNSTR